MPASRRRDDVEGEDDLPVADAGEARRASRCRRRRRAAGRSRCGAARTMISAASGTNSEQRVGERRTSQPGAEPGEDLRDVRAGGDDGALVDLQEARADQAGAERHDQRVDAEDADADAVGEADQRGRHRARAGSRATGSM